LEARLFAEYGNRVRDLLLDYDLRVSLNGRYGFGSIGRHVVGGGYPLCVSGLSDDSLSAGASRLVATGVSFALCLPYLWVFPFTVPGLAALIGIGTLAMMLLGRQDDIVTTGITTVVVMVVAAISPTDAWQQPVLRLADTVVGVGIGVGGKWVASYLYFRTVGIRSP
jgi:hypothetical protein